MLIKASFTLTAQQAEVWALLQEVERIGACVPGVGTLDPMGDDSYRGTLKVKLGPISAAFGGQVKFVERTAPERMIAEISGLDRVSASLVKATFTGLLIPAEDGTQLAYEMEVALRGKLGQFGGAVLQATAKKMTAQFVQCFSQLLAETTAAD
jgi:carbon monoxide dehydrogenase subunit G